jgi:aryl-alcohol dehydrogenase-like predicted oxidoreductase
VLTTLTEIAGVLGATPAQVALAWLLARKGVTAPLLGFLSPAQVNEAAGATQLSLTPEFLDRLEAASRRMPGLIEPSCPEPLYP